MNELHESVESFLAAGIMQQLTRTRIDGVDRVAGIFRCDFEREQRHYALNIPVHPALSDVPTVEAICLDCDARIRVTDCQKFGVRIEIVLNESPTEDQSVFVDVVISSKH